MNTTPGPQHPLYPWRLDTNNRYKDAIKIVMDLSTASLVIPVFFLRNLLSIPNDQPLIQALNFRVYCSWACLALAIIFGFLFYCASAKWVRLAWEKKAGFFRLNATDKFVEKILDITFVGAIVTFRPVA